MLNCLFIFRLLILCSLLFPTWADAAPSDPDNPVKDEQEIFLRRLRAIKADPEMLVKITGYFESSINSLYSDLQSRKKMNQIEKEKAIRTLIYFMKEAGTRLTRSVIDLYALPQTMDGYKQVLMDILLKRPLFPSLQPMNTVQTELLKNVFSQYKESSIIEELATYKRVATTPQYILQFVENHPDFRYADSLLILLAANEPMKMAYYLRGNSGRLSSRIINSSDPYLKLITTFSTEKNVSELLPFLSQLADGSLTRDSILSTRSSPVVYFQLMVNSMQSSLFLKEKGNLFLKPLKKGIHDRAMAFYVNELNNLHSSPDAVRFASVKDLRPEDLYYIIISSGEELYTSSYLGLYKRLMDLFRGGNADSLFDIIHYDGVRTFIRLAANYNVLEDLLNKLSEDKKKELIRRFIRGLDKDPTESLEKAMDIADSYNSLVKDPTISEMVRKELKFNLDQCQQNNKYQGVRLYNILTDMFGMVSEVDGLNRLWARLGNYELIRQSELINEKGEMNEVVLFYGDEDGVGSFSNFLRYFSDTRKWTITRNDKWISIRSVSGKALQIFANRPLNMEEGLDLRAQDSMYAYMGANNIHPSILMHRGHSYHLDKTMNRISPSVRLAILGSCGGYNRAISFASINKDVQVIGSKKTGSKSINDPFLYYVNEKLVTGEDLNWPEIWKDLELRFSKEEGALTLFKEYFPPSENLGLFLLKLYNQ